MSIVHQHLRSGCKINLYLHVLEKLSNGYHAIDSLFIPLPEPHDTLDVTLRCPLNAQGTTDKESESESDPPHAGIQVRFKDAVTGQPCVDIDPENNTLTLAYERFAHAAGFAPPMNVLVRKMVPHGAGLGGGSANAAAVLMLLNERLALSAERPLTSEKLIAVGKSVGADVPVFLLGMAARGLGIGDCLTVVQNPLAGLHMVLVCPDITVSSGWAYRAVDERRSSPDFRETLVTYVHKSAKKIYEEINNLLTNRGCLDIYTSPHETLLRNDFEDVVFARFPALRDIHQSLTQHGAVITRMSGSGSSVFALFRKKKNAEIAAKSLAEKGLCVYRQTV